MYSCQYIELQYVQTSSGATIVCVKGKTSCVIMSIYLVAVCTNKFLCNNSMCQGKDQLCNHVNIFSYSVYKQVPV